MPDYAFSVFSFIGLLLCAAPAYFNWKIPGRPWATLILIGWIFAGNFFSFIDSVIWSNNDPNTWWDGVVWCDIGARIKASYDIGVPAAAIGICRFLADATNPDPSQKDMKHSRTKRNIIDFFLGVGLPFANIGLRYIVQPYRYYILGVMGCTSGIDYTWPSIPLFLIWSPMLTFVAAIYAGILSFLLLLT
jgi:pheromone a factor receptor